MMQFKLDVQEVRTKKGIKLYSNMFTTNGTPVRKYSGIIIYRPILRDYGFKSSWKIQSQGRITMEYVVKRIKQLEKKHPELIQ